MNCGITEMQWTDYLDGTCPAEERREIESHLRECANCRSESEALRQIDQRLRIECGLFGSRSMWGCKRRLRSGSWHALRRQR